MKLLANENFPLASVKYLILKGFDIKSIGIDNPSVSDSEVIKTAAIENRIILTFDRDYGELIFKHDFKPEMGVIYLRLTAYDSEDPGRIVEKLLTNSELEFRRKLTVVTIESVRQRGY